MNNELKWKDKKNNIIVHVVATTIAFILVIGTWYIITSMATGQGRL